MLLATGTITSNGKTAATSFRGGGLFIHLNGTFGGGTVTVELSYDTGTTWIPVSADAVYTSSVIRTVNLPDCWVRLDMSGATSPTVRWAISERREQN